MNQNESPTDTCIIMYVYFSYYGLEDSVDYQSIEIQYPVGIIIIMLDTGLLWP